LVREYDTAPVPELMLVVEPWLPTNPKPLDLDMLEAALNLAVTVAFVWATSFRTRVTLVLLGETEITRTTSPGEITIREALAPLATTTGSARFQTAGIQHFDRSLNRAARVVVSSRATSPAAGALTRLTGRPFVLVSPGDQLSWYQPPIEIE
jgi:hypothetical protein